MTREEIAKALDEAADGGPSLQLPRDVHRFAAKVRVLPVIATCGECRFHSSAVAAMAGPFHNVVGGDYCSHEGASGDGCDPGAAPPSWCPLRGKR